MHEVRRDSASSLSTTGYWKPVKSIKGAGKLPARVRIPWPEPAALLQAVPAMTYKEGTLERWEGKNKYGGGMVLLDDGGRITVKPGQFEVWAERENG